MNKDTINPILFGLAAGVITYLILYVDVNYENKKLSSQPVPENDGKCSCPSFYVTLKVPLIIGALVWACATYFETGDKTDTDIFVNSSPSIFDQDVFTDLPDF